ncbi:MAG: hypothetical protein E7159_00560 [Firmicutes bacterium]|nr:hypothetical protein [Bacillota bacterium]
MFENDTNFLDQHFLVDENIIKTFIDSCEITKDDIVLEVGPGKGVLTKYLKEQANKLLVIEKDVRLIPFLKDYDVTYRDVLHCDIPDVNKIVTSLPYSITEPFLYKLLDVKFDKLIMMCGKNFVDNLESNNTKLSIMCNLYFNYTKICDVKPDSFNPKPKVMSSLITMTKKDEGELSKKDKIVRLLYKYRYMKVKNALKEILIKLDNLTQRQAKDIIKNYNINEDISNKLFDELSNVEVVELYKLIN